jgi:hypothetical protein
MNGAFRQASLWPHSLIHGYSCNSINIAFSQF